MSVFKKYEVLYPYIIILCIGILAFIIPCKTWNFVGESYPSIYGITNIKNLNTFITGNILENMNSNTVNVSIQPKNLTFFNSIYRPALLLTYLIEYKLFGINAYLYYLLIILIHILNSFLLFYLLTNLFSGIVALFCTLFFTINPSQFLSIGEVCRHQNQLSLLFFLLSMLLFKKFLESKTNLLVTLPAGILYLLCILMRETFLVAPFLVVLAIPLVYKHKFTLKKILFILSMLLTAILIYFIMRRIGYPLAINSSHNPFIFGGEMLYSIPKYIISFAKELYLIFVSIFFYHKFYFFCEVHNLVFLYKIIKDSLIVGLIILFILNTQKKLFLYFSICFIAASWPFFVIKALSSMNIFCYFYESLPFAAAALGTLLYYNSYTKSKLFKIIFYTASTLFVVSNTAGMMIYQHRCSTAGEKFKNGIKNLKLDNNEILQDKVFLITNVKNILGSRFGTAHAFQLNFMENKKPKAVLLSLDIYSLNNDLTQYLDVNFDNDGSKITLKSKNTDLLWFEINNLQEEDLNSCVEKFEANIKSEQKIYDLTIVLKNDFITQKQALIIWDDNCNKFHVKSR